MPGATALHARCCRTAWNHDERCNHQRVLRSEQPSCQCPCSSLRASVLMHSAAAVCGLSRRSIRLRECHDALAIITRASSAGSQQAEEDKARRVRRASSCPAVPPAVLPDVRRPFDPALFLSLAQRTRTPSRLLMRLAVRVGCSENLLPSQARRHAKSRTGGLPAPSCTASRDGLWSSL